MDLELEAISQKRLQPEPRLLLESLALLLAELSWVDRRFGRSILGFRGNVVPVSADPARSAGELKISHVVGLLNQRFQRDPAQIDAAARHHPKHYFSLTGATLRQDTAWRVGLSAKPNALLARPGGWPAGPEFPRPRLWI